MTITFMKHKAFLIMFGNPFLSQVLFLLCYCCVLLCYLLNFQLKLRLHCRLLVLCFAWACIFVSMVWHLFFFFFSISPVAALMLQFKVVLF